MLGAVPDMPDVPSQPSETNPPSEPGEVSATTLALLRTVLAPLGEAEHAELLTGGMFATSYRVHLADGSRVVVKSAPTAHDRLLRYELDLVRTEAAVYRIAETTPALCEPRPLMPRVLLTDFSRSVMASDVVAVTHLDGMPLVDAGTLSPHRHAHVKRELGTFMARLHSVHGDYFGYPNRETGLHAATWPEAFGLIVDALLTDARRWGTPLPDAEIRAALARHHDALAEVTTPCLVHTDLWSGNLFIDPLTADLTGVIDPERSMWGDPLFELVGADQLGHGAPPTELLAAYASAGGDFRLDTDAGRTRLELYRVCMSLVLLVEIAPRGYAGDWLHAHRAAAAGNLERALAVLSAPLSAPLPGAPDPIDSLDSLSSLDGSAREPA